MHIPSATQLQISLIAEEITTEAHRLGWSTTKIRDELLDRYGQPVFCCLAFNQITDFRDYLRSL